MVKFPWENDRFGPVNGGFHVEFLDFDRAGMDLGVNLGQFLGRFGLILKEIPVIHISKRRS